MRSRLVTILVALSLSTLLAACEGSPTSNNVAPANAGDATSATLLPNDIYALPAFDFAKFEQLGTQLHGTPVIVNIWASWCGPCRTEAPMLADAAKKYAGRVQFVGIDIQDSRSDAVAFMKRYEWSYPSLFDASGDIRDHLGFVGQPDTIFYDENGKVSSTWTGPLSESELASRIASIGG